LIELAPRNNSYPILEKIRHFLTLFATKLQYRFQSGVSQGHIGIKNFISIQRLTHRLKTTKSTSQQKNILFLISLNYSTYLTKYNMLLNKKRQTN